MKPERLVEIQGIVGRSRDNTDDKPDLYWACRDLLTRNAELEAALDDMLRIAHPITGDDHDREEAAGELLAAARSRDPQEPQT